MARKKQLTGARKPLTKAQVLDHLAKKTGTTKKLANQFLQEFVTLALKEAKDTFNIPGLGKLVIVNRKKRMGRNPATGREMVIPAKKVLKLRIAGSAKAAVLSSKTKKG